MIGRVGCDAFTLQGHAKRLEGREREGGRACGTEHEHLNAHEQARGPDDAKHEQVERGGAGHATRVGAPPH